MPAAFGGIPSPLVSLKGRPALQNNSLNMEPDFRRHFYSDESLAKRRHCIPQTREYTELSFLQFLATESHLETPLNVGAPRIAPI